MSDPSVLASGIEEIKAAATLLAARVAVLEARTPAVTVSDDGKVLTAHVSNANAVSSSWTAIP